MALHPKVKQLYDTLKGGGADVGTEDEFNNWFFAPGNQGYQNRKSVHSTLKDGGADAGETYEEFAGWLGLHAVKPQGDAGKASAHGKTQSRFPADVEERRMRTARPPKPLDRKKAERQLAQNQRSIEAQQQRWQKEQARQQKYIEQRTKSVPGGMERVEDRAKEYLATGEASPVPIAPNPEVVRGDYQFNPDSGKMEQTWLTGDGSEYFDRGIAEFDTALKQMPEDERALLEREQELIGMGILRRGRELDEEYESQSWWEKILDAMSADYEDDMGPHQRRYQNDEEMQSLMAASRKNRDALRILEDMRGGDMNSFWHTFGTTVANGYTFTGGRAEMNDAKAIMRSSERMSEIQGKIERGEKLTDVENAALSLAQNTAWDNAIQAMYGDEYGAWAKAGGAAVGSLEMMPDFLAGMGILKGFGQAGIRLLMRNSAKGLGKYMLKGLGATLGTMAGGAVMANTIQAERTFGKAALKDAGSWWFGDDGEYVLGHYEGDRFVSGGESLAEALFHAQQEAIPEAASEGIGEFLPGVGSVLGKIGLSRIAKPLAALNGKSWYRSYQRLLKSAGWHGVAGEAFEEYFGALDGLLMGDLEGVKSLGDPRTHIDIWLSCATLGPLLNAPMIMTSAGRALYAPRAYYKAKHNVGKADRLAAFRLTDARWEPWRERIDGATNEEMADLLMEVRDSQELAPQEKKAVFDYAAALQGYRGWNLGQYIFGRDEESEGVETDAAGAASQSDPANEVGNSYHAGYNAADEEQAGVKERLDVAHRRVEDAGLQADLVEELDEGRLATMLDGNVWADDQKAAVQEYLEARAAYEGMVQHVQDDMEGAIAESEATVEQRTHPDTGAVHRAELKTGGEVFIISGNVALMPDNSIDIENSDGDLIVLDPATGGKRMIHISDLASADEPVMADQLKEEAATTIQETMATDASNRIDGVLSFQPGDEYTLPFGEEQHTITIIGDAGDGVNTVVSVDGGEQQLMPMQMIQEAADAQREARIAEQAAVAAAGQAGPTEITEETDVTEPVEGEWLYSDQPIREVEKPRGTVQVFTRQRKKDGMTVTQAVAMRNGEEVSAPTLTFIPWEEGKYEAVDVNAPEIVGIKELREKDGVVAATLLVRFDDNSLDTQESKLVPIEKEKQEDAMPMNGDEVDWFATSPERGHRFLYDEAGLSPEEADAVVANSVKDAEKELEKVSKKAPKPGNAAQLNKYRAEKEAHEQQVAAAQAAVDYWKGVQATQQQVVADLVRRQADERAAQDAAARQAAIEAEAQYQAEQEAKKAEQAERGPFTPGQNVIDKWKSAKKIDGRKDVKVLADGTVVAGHYVLHEAGATTPSHDPATGWKPTEGFPVNENGGSVNDRDYERDRAAQEITIRMSETFDGRAYQDVPIISDEGIDYSGNGRTIAGDMAARNNTDGAYLETARQYSEKYGFTAEDMDQFQHPRVDFMLDKKLPYTPEVFAKFNAQEMKGQNLTESAVKLGKTVDDTTFNDIVGLINQFDTMSDFYADGTAPAEAISMLLRAGVITPMQHAQMFDGDSVSGQGKEMLENLLLGKAFEGNPEAIRQIRSMPSVRQQIVGALAEVANNSTLGDYSLEDVISQAVALVHKARNDKNSSVKQGDSVSDYARQLSLFPNITGGATIADLQNTMVLLLGDILNGRGQLTFKNVLIKYNYSASQTVGYTGSLFTDASPEGLLNDAIQLINNSNKNEIKQEITAAVEQRKSAARQGSEPVTAVNTGDEGSPAGSGAERVEKTVSPGLIDPRTMSDEERQRRGDMLRNAPAIEVDANQIVSTQEQSARKAAEAWWDNNVGEPHWYDTEVGEVEINRNSVESSLAHGYGQMKLDAITSLVDGFGNAVYLGTMPDGTRQEGVQNHYFAYPIMYNGKRCYVFCRALHDNNTNRLYVHEVFVEEGIKKGNTLQTAASQPHGGIALYRDILANVLDPEKEASNRHTTAKQSAETAGASLTGEQSGTTPETSMNAPTTSEGKGSTENANVQGNSEKNVDQSVAQAEAEVDTEPTDGQKEAGNYKKGHVKIDGFDVTIEQPKGSVRSGVDASGKAWSQEMHNTYGYIRGTEGVDGDHIDVFLSDHLDSWNGMVYVVDQVNKDGSFDEHKVMYGFDSEQEARDAYLSNYEEGWTGLGNITGVTRDEFKKWVDSSHRKTKPFAEYKSVKPVEEPTADNGGTAAAHGTSQRELAGMLAEEFKEELAGAKANIEIVAESASDGEVEAVANVTVDGEPSDIWLASGAGRTMDEYWKRVYVPMADMGYQEIADLAEAFNKAQGKEVCRDDEDAKRINFDSIDDAVDFERWHAENKVNPQKNGAKREKITESVSNTPNNVSLVLEQVRRIKSKVPDALVLVRIGNEYTAYNEDAVSLHDVLGDDVSFAEAGERGATHSAGFTKDSLESLLPKLIKAGHKVSLVDGLEADAKMSKVENAGDVAAAAVSEREAALRDGLVEVLRGAGIEVVTDVEEGQRVLDAVNGRVQAMGFANSREEFDNTRDRAVAETGIVMTGLAEEEVTVVDVPRHDFTGVAPIKQAEAWGKKNLVTPKDKKGNYIDKPKLKDGTEYSISSNAVGKFLSKSATKNSDNLGVHLSVLKKLKDVIHESMEAEVHPDYKKDDAGKRDPKNGYNPDNLVHRLYGAVDIDGKTYRVKTTIIENGNESRNYPHSYEVTEIELLDDSMAGSESRSVNIGREGHDTKNRLSNNSIAGAKLLQGVEKSYDPGKKLLDESEKSTESGVKEQRVENNAALSEALFEGAKKKFGTTTDIREAGYVLPDGSMLDFSGRHELDPGTDSGFLKGQRTFDHRGISQISFVYDENGDEVDTGLETTMPDFIERGAIRIDYNAGNINLAVAPTAAQRRVLRTLIAGNGGEVQVDFGNGWDSDHYAEYSEAKAARVLADIDRYFGEGIKPQGDYQFFRTADGTAYGFVKDGRIYIDPRIATSETPIHEYTHLWCAALRRVNPAAWARLKEALLGQKDVLEHVKKLYPELEGDELMDEVFAHYSGRRGRERLQREQEREVAKARGIFDKARVVAVFDRIRRALDNFWLEARHLFAGKTEGLEKLSAEDFADMALADLLRGFNPKEEVRKLDADGRKAAQLRLVTDANAMTDTYHTGIRRIDDIKTYEEAVAEGEGIGSYPDFTEEDARAALDRGRATVYSSHPIEPGSFVSMSRMEAEEYAGGGEVYSQEVPLEDVAWIYANEGQYAPVGDGGGAAAHGTRTQRTAPTFYSNAERAVEGVKQGKAKAEQWKAMLTKAGGIKAGEDKWMGLTEWLDEHKGETLTKEQVLEFVRQNGVQMEEVGYQEGLSASQQQSLQELQDEYDGILSEYDAIYDQLDNEYNDFMMEMEEKYGDGWEYEMDGNERATKDRLFSERQKYGSQGEQWGMAWDEMVSRHGDDFNQGFYNDGTGTLAVSTDAHGNIDEAALYFLGEENGRPINSTRLDYTTEGLENKREIAFVVPDVEPYQEDDEIHFGPENQGRAVMWVRFGEARDADGKRVLVIDEIQSNRHQDAREKGYDLMPKDRARYESLAAQRKQAMESYYARAREVALNGGNFETAWAEDNRAGELFDAWGEIEKEMKRFTSGDIPAAPFEKNWHEVAMKRMLRLAAEEGFDKVAWTTGMQQAERYDIGGVVDEIYSSVKSDGNRVVTIYLKSGRDMKLELDSEGKVVPIGRGEQFAGRHISEVVGKGVSEKIMSTDRDSLSEAITGDDLSIGGEGMKGFYDQMLPRFMDKYGKKWGVKTGEVTLATPGQEVMHSVDVTPEMRRSVLEQGQPLFQKSGERELEAINERFNEQLQRQIDGTLPKGHVYELGMPGDVLLSTGIDNLPIELVASRLVDKSMQDNHPFDLEEVRDLPKSIHTPLAVFRSATHVGRYVILTVLKHGNRNFVVAIETNRQVGKLFVNSIRSVHPRNGMNIVNWINEGLAEYIRPDFEAQWLTPFKNELRSKPQYNSADVRAQLKSAAKIAKEFVNPPLQDEKNIDTGDEVLLREEDELREAQIHSANFKRWFGDWESDPENASKVVDENGEPKVVLHGTPNGDFYIFDSEKAGSNTDQGWLGRGFYFYGNAPEYASQYAGKNGRVLQVYLDIKNPYIASVEEFNRLAEANDPEMSRRFREQLEDEGYDGVYYNGDLNEEWVAFRPEQIKSATENNGDFDSSNPDMRLREALVEGGRLAISQGENGKWRIEGMPGEFGSRYAALDEWRERAAGNVVWYLSEDGDYIEVEGNGDMYEMMSADFNAPAASGTPSKIRGGVKQRERMARQQATRSASGRRMVDELAEKLGVKVRYVEDMSEQERAQFSERQLRSKGWYNPRTGEVFINLGRHTRLYDILSTFLHETVAHKGLRRLFGKDFNTFLDNVYNNVNKGIRSEIDRMAEVQKSRASEAQRARHDDEHWRRVATEEYMAKLAERLNLNHPEERTIWEKIKGFLLDKLRKIGVTVADSLSDNDLRGILWESYHSMESEGVMGYAKGVAFRDQMEREANNRGTATAHGTSIIAAEPQAQYTGSLFDMLPQAGAWARMMSNMSERELFSEMAQDGPNVTSSYSEEYDRRHIKEYNQACDEIQAQLERELPGEDRLLELLQDAEAQWADGAYKDSRRTGVLAAIDTISRALDKEQAELPSVEEDNLYRDDDIDWDAKASKEDLAEHLRMIPYRVGIKPSGVTTTISNDSDLEALLGVVEDALYKDIVKNYNNRKVFGCYDHESGMIIVFTNKVGTRKEAESTWWHEKGHLVYDALSLKDKEECGRAAMDWLHDHGHLTDDQYNHYSDADRGTEGAAWLVKYLFENFGTDGILYGNFTGNGKITKLAAAIQNYLKNGEENDNNRLRQPANGQGANEGRSQAFGTGAQGPRGRLNQEIGDTDDVDVAGFDAGRLTLEERITAGMMKAAADNRAAVAARTAAMRALGGNLSKLRQAMARQREYDRGTVDSIVRLARSVMESGFFRGFSPYEVKRLMSLINHAAGREDITKQAGKVVDLLLKHQLLSCENLLHEQMRTRGSKLNSQGVEVQAGLDIEGQRMVGAMRHALNLEADALQERINNTLDRMFSPDQALADVAAAEYQGLLLAQQYIEEIKGSKQEENELRQELKNAKEDLQAGTITREQYNQFVAETENAIRENRLERVAAYDRLTTALGAGLGASVQRAKEWREAQRERINEIRHNANSDLEGVPADEHVKPGWMQRAANWSLVRFFMKPLATFDYMLRMLGSKNVNGEGYLWGRFMGGWTEATEREWRNLRAAHKALDEKASEVFGKKMRWSDLFTIERKMPGMDVSFWDAGEEKIHHLTQGNLLYIYMVNKMSDGRMKLRKMGINEEDVEAIRQMLDPRFIELADWLQEEFLVNKRNDYNAVYQRMFGASMAAIEHYFPLKINSRSRGQEEDLSSETYLDDNNMGSTITGSIIKRRRNSLPLDVTGADAFDVVLAHLQDMEHWAAFAEFNRDLNTLLSYKRFRNRMLNMSSVRFGSGKTLWMNFKRTCAIASGAYRPKVDRDSVDTSLVNVAKGVTAAKISFRIYTALKQLLSYPAYLSEASGLELIKSSNPIGAVKAWNWAIDNLPGFAQRWQSRQAGDSRLRESDADWGLWRNKIVETAGRWGMSPNAFIDGLTVAMGAKAIYETKLKRYRKAGYPDEQAKRRALRDASISYNETQQSNANAYLSAMQLDRSAASVALTVFRNASMGYQRRMFQAMANLKHVFTPGYKAQALEFMTKQMVRDGLNEQQAKQSAERIYRRAKYKNLADFAIFGWVMQMAWNLGPYIPYLLMGDDDDDKKEMLEDAALHAIAGGVEGLSGGNVMSDTYNAFRSGEVSSYVNTELLPLMSDIESLKRKLGQDMVEGAHDLVNLAVQAGVGVNPQQITDFVAAVLDVADGDSKLAHEAGFAILRVLSVPQSQLDKLYIDELGLIARDARKLNTGQMAERYARYKMRRGSAYTSWAYSDEGKRKAEERYLKRFETKVKERVAELDDEQLEDNFNTDDALRRKWVGQAVAKRAGGTDSYGSPKTDYGVVYERKRDYTDLAQDILLQVEKKKAKEAGDSDRYKALDRAQKELTTIKKGKHTKTIDEPGLGEGFDDEVMTRLRERRRELLKELGIM